MKLRSQYDREILKLAVPALGALAAEPTYILVDTAVVGHLGRPQLAALGVSAVILTTLFAIFNFLHYDTTAQVGRASGAGQEEAARRLGAQALWLCLGVGIVLAAGVALLAPQLVHLMGRRGRGGRLRGLVSAHRRGRAPVGLRRARGAGIPARDR